MERGVALLALLASLTFHEAIAQVPSAPVIPPNPMAGINSITIEWTQPAGPTVDSYSIAYSYDLVECPGEVQGTGSVSNISGNATSYMLTDLRSYADYTIMLSAENGNGLTSAANVVVRTADANPTTGVENFTAVAVSPTSISTTWSRIQCSNRNTAINRYVFFTYLGTTFISAVPINSVSDVNSYMTSNLRPRTEYELRVRADNLDINGLKLSPLAVIDVSTALPEEVGFFVNGNVYPNNSAVVLETDSFGNLEDLWCVSDLAQCCSSTETGSDTLGSWTLPDGTVAQTTGTDLLVSWGPSRVALSGRATIPTGVFTCMIPDASSTVRTVYLYVYAMGQTLGPPIISYLQFNNSLPAMVCRSTGRLVESVQWSKDGVAIPSNSSNFEQNQKIIGFEDATYEYILSGTANKFLGAFSCEVTDSTGQTAQRTITLNGVNIVHSPLPLQVGSNESLTCVSEVGKADIITWTVNGRVLASGFNVSSLDISFSPVNDTRAIHGNTFICLVNLRGEVINQTLEVSVEAPHPPFSVSIATTNGSLVAGSGYSMTCEVRELYAGLTGTPSIQWSAVVENRFFATVTQTTISDNVATSVATFDRQDTSDSGDYVCTGFLNSSLWANTMEIRHVEMVRFQFPDPVVSITQSDYSIEGPVPITLNCSASVDRMYVNLGEFQYVFTWRRGTVALATMPEDASNLVGYSTYTTPVQGPFQRNYSCSVQVRERNGRLGSSSTVTAIKTVMTRYNDSCLSTSISKPSSQCRGNCIVECSITVGCSISSAPHIRWRKDNTTLNEVSSVLSIGQDMPGRYSCDVTVPYNVDGSSAQGNLMKSSSIRLIAAPAVTLTQSDYTIVSPIPITLTCTARVDQTNLGEFQYAFTWQGTNTTVDEDGYSTYTIPAQEPFQRNYTCSVEVTGEGLFSYPADITKSVRTEYDESCLRMSINETLQCGGEGSGNLVDLTCNIAVNCLNSTPEIKWARNDALLKNEIASVLSQREVGNKYTCYVTVKYNLTGSNSQVDLRQMTSAVIDVCPATTNIEPFSTSTSTSPPGIANQNLYIIIGIIAGFVVVLVLILLALVILVMCVIRSKKRYGMIKQNPPPVAVAPDVDFMSLDNGKEQEAYEEFMKEEPPQVSSFTGSGEKPEEKGNGDTTTNV